MSELPPAIAKLRAFLDALDVPSSTLKRDPEGATWLPPELQALVAADPACREDLRRFVDRELELFGSVRQRPDALFTARVLRAAEPVQIAGAGLDPQVRSWILGFSYALATGVAFVMLAPLLGLAMPQRWAAEVGAAVGLEVEAGPEPWGIALVGGALVAVLAIAFAPLRRSSP